MTEQTYTISQLAAAAGVTPRTIRYYTAEGLLPPPEARGRYALYGPEHLSRLRLIAQLKATYLPLGEIRARLGGLSPAQLAALAEEHTETERPASAADYVARVLEGRQSPGHVRPKAVVGSFMPHRGLAEQAAPYDPVPKPPRVTYTEPANTQRYPRVLPLPTGHAEPLPVAPPQATERIQAEPWRRITLAPDVELHVREPATPESERLVTALLVQAHALLEDSK